MCKSASHKICRLHAVYVNVSLAFVVGPKPKCRLRAADILLLYMFKIANVDVPVHILQTSISITNFVILI